MKKKLTSLMMCAVLVFTMLAATACSYNWSDAKNTVSLDRLSEVLTGTIVSTKKVDTVDKSFVDKVLHDLAAKGATSRDLRETDAFLEGDDKVTFTSLTMQVKGDDGKGTGITPATTSYTFKLTEAQTDVVAESIRKYVNEHLAGDNAVKVGATVKIENVSLVGTPKTADNKTTYTFASGTNEAGTAVEGAKNYDISFTISTAKIDGAKVKPTDGDVLTIYYISKKGEEATVTSSNWSYNFKDNAVSGGSVYDPAVTVAELTKPLYRYLIDAQKSLDESAALRANGVAVGRFDSVKLTVTASYNGEGSDVITVSDVNKLSVDFNLSEASVNHALMQLLRDEVVAGERKVGTEYTFKRSLYVKSNEGKPALTLTEKVDNVEKTRFYTQADSNVTMQEVSIKYKVEAAYGGDWSEWTDTETGTVYNYYLAGIKKLADTTKLDILTNSSVANGTKYDNEDTRYLYVNAHEEKGEDGTTVIGKHYEISAYGIELFMVKTVDGVTKYLGEEDADIKYTFKVNEGETAAETTIDTEEKAVRYAVEKALDKYYELACEKYAVEAMWKKITEDVAVVGDIPTALLDSYYNEYYENTRYEFYKSNNGKVTVGEGNDKKTYTKFEDYLVYKTKAANWDEVRTKVNEMAKTDLTPRLIVYALADKLGVTVSNEEYNEQLTLAYQNYVYNVWMPMYYQYSGYFGSDPAALESLMASWGFPTVNSVDEYVELVLFGKENAMTGILYDKTMKKIYEDAASVYGITFDFLPKK